MAKKKAINAIMMERKKTATDLRWRLNISEGDFELWSKLDRDARWTSKRLEDLGPLPPIQFLNKGNERVDNNNKSKEDDNEIMRV